MKASPFVWKELDWSGDKGTFVNGEVKLGKLEKLGGSWMTEGNWRGYSMTTELEPETKGRVGSMPTVMKTTALSAKSTFFAAKAMVHPAILGFSQTQRPMQSGMTCTRG